MFKKWLEAQEAVRNRDFWEQFFLGVWNLDKHQGGLEKNLAGFDANDLIHTSEFQQLLPQQQQEIVNRIEQGNGTVGDLVAIAMGDNRPGVMDYGV